jgi:AhpD family alkylhydroperoxidase
LEVDNSEIEFYNTMGKLVFSKRLTTSCKFSLPHGTLQVGIYIVKLIRVRRLLPPPGSLLPNDMAESKVLAILNQISVYGIMAREESLLKEEPMPYITLENQLPGIIGLLEYRPETGNALSELTQVLLRGPSALTVAERELIATLVSWKNNCTFCATSHTAAADAFLGEHETSEKVKSDFLSSPVSDKMKALLTVATQVCENGKSVTPQPLH